MKKVSAKVYRAFNSRNIFFICLTAILVMACVGFGFRAGYTRSFPYDQVRMVRDVFRQLKNWRTILGIRPDEYLFPSERSAEIAEPIDDGALIFVAGYLNGEPGGYLIDRDGNILKGWPLPEYGQTMGDSAHVKPRGSIPATGWNVMAHGAALLPNGSVVMNHTDNGLVKVDTCGKVEWVLKEMTHHAVTVTPDGSFWVPRRTYVEGPTGLPHIRPPFYEQHLMHVSASGKVLDNIPLARTLVDQGLIGLLLPTGDNMPQNPVADLSHLNDVDVLTPDSAAAFPMFKPGDLLISMRNLNLLVVMDPKTREVKWHQTGPWLRQHDPDFAFDGRIEIFDNRMGLEIEGSQVVSVDPATGKTEVIYGGRDGERFYSEILGKIQAMPSGHVLITIPNEGRLLEVDLTGRPVWQFINRVDDEFRGILWSADVLPEGYLQDGALDCVK